MEQKIEEKIELPKKKNQGGARPGAGRKKGGQNLVSVNSLLAALEEKSKGQTYEQILVEDFLKARTNNDTQLTVKYHNLILNKVMNTLAKVEITDSQDAIEAKQIAFQDALAKLVGISKD